MKREDFVDVKIIQLQEIYQNVSAACYFDRAGV